MKTERSDKTGLGLETRTKGHKAESRKQETGEGSRDEGECDCGVV